MQPSTGGTAHHDGEVRMNVLKRSTGSQQASGAVGMDRKHSRARALKVGSRTRRPKAAAQATGTAALQLPRSGHSARGAAKGSLWCFGLRRCRPSLRCLVRDMCSNTQTKSAIRSTNSDSVTRSAAFLGESHIRLRCLLSGNFSSTFVTLSENTTTSSSKPSSGLK